MITPAILTVVEKGADIAYYYNLAEEEKKDTNTNGLKEVKEMPYPKDLNLQLSQISKKKENYFYYFKRHYDQVMDVIIPPPEAFTV
ncbi:hypothetical protein JM658_03140 [Joostella atrarenae]|uniref:Uncharacterized protein n=1 Tax=Joostella atrarenae TaxID=679257 RepID=A0ABS9J052_9FLAO|nr:hypothetical protein [Joostella atrarenae]MCF8713811.1 hypothetical protein [Joostella atrarenae]